MNRLEIINYKEKEILTLADKENKFSEKQQLWHWYDKI